jgi:hypothetical protein
VIVLSAMLSMTMYLFPASIACWTAAPGVAVLYVMTVAFQCSADAASVNAAAPREHDTPAHTRIAALTPPGGALDRGSF